MIPSPYKSSDEENQVTADRARDIARLEHNDRALKAAEERIGVALEKSRQP